ncbi:MAG: H/ACA ribonucleoprotein complex subunit 3 [archaeon GW2011_AR17]|nr:MAG: H/ACA ribonucleoprotein complex subunit 3 [archaeon GW2011_AR17]MBS3154345.1 ribosome biogenesis protein [Candidatus Woesearchaeota archaeon]HIH15283.1 ribosome biogenesis protein [Nanoarchaeota archaeon]HIH58562.1 ribosome biogenesis protein [Nanoarchaeota archaeon]HII13757.1 ribosome biogenesis protein [Nanoarchaeota archaeon]
MTPSILYCSVCKKYTLKEMCSCGQKTTTTKPAKFSVDDKWGKYRREYKREHKE